MTARLRMFALALAGLTLAAAVAAAPEVPHAAGAPGTPNGVGASVPRAATSAPHPAHVTRRAATRPSGGAKAPKRTSVTPAPGPRTLGDVHIEGEIAAPQVLFITARDQRRFVEFQHHRYLSTSRELGARTAFPTRIVSDAPPVPPQPEASR
jgi:hypothetical protein